MIQRELNTHMPTFAEGVRAAMREDPDVILVGELRDAETISMAMTAAETGHLVLGTLHTTGAVKTIDRIIDALPIEEREQTKSFLAQSLLAVVTQVLIKTADARGRKAMCEIMVVTKAIGKLIKTDQTHQIPAQLQTGRDARHADARSGAARREQPPKRSIPTTRIRTRPTSACSSTTSPIPSRTAEARPGAEHDGQAPARRRTRKPMRRPIDSFLATRCSSKKGSDLHFIAGDPARIRLYGDLHNAAAGAARGAVREGSVATRSCRRRRSTRLEEKHGADFAYNLPGGLALPRERDATAVRHGLRCSGRSLQSVHAGSSSKLPESVRNLCESEQRPDPGDRQDRAPASRPRSRR